MTTIMKFKADSFTDLTPEQIARVAPYVRSTPPADQTRNYWFEFEGDVLAVARAVPEIKWTIVSADLPVTQWEYLLGKIKELADAVTNGSTRYNERCQVVVPDLGLLMINEVTYADGCCTEELQTSYLDKGWRILAVCPQPDQRRPDYILGRTKRPD